MQPARHPESGAHSEFTFSSHAPHASPLTLPMLPPSGNGGWQMSKGFRRGLRIAALVALSGLVAFVSVMGLLWLDHEKETALPSPTGHISRRPHDLLLARPRPRRPDGATPGDAATGPRLDLVSGRAPATVRGHGRLPAGPMAGGSGTPHGTGDHAAPDTRSVAGVRIHSLRDAEVLRLDHR